MSTIASGFKLIYHGDKRLSINGQWAGTLVAPKSFACNTSYVRLEFPKDIINKDWEGLDSYQDSSMSKMCSSYIPDLLSDRLCWTWDD